MAELEERVAKVNTVLLKLRVFKSFFQTKFRKFKTRQDIESWQNSQFNQLKKSALTHSAYYNEYVHLPLEKWPIINKQIHLENFNQINTKNLSLNEVLRIAEKSEVDREFSEKYNGISVGLSSGTSGNRGVFVASEKERAEWAGSILARLLPDFRPQKIAFFLRANNNLYETVKSRYIRFEFFDLMQPMDLHIKRLVKYNPTILIAPAQVLVILAKYKSAGMGIAPRKIISVAEVLTEDDKMLIERVFEQKVHQVYQCTEGFLAHTCSQGELHLNEDAVLFEKEWINQERGIFIPVVSDLRRESQPVIRYRLDDVLVENFTQCPCGSPMTRLKKIMGRVDDILFFKSVDDLSKTQALFPDFICRVISAVDRGIQEFKVKQQSAGKILVELDSAGLACQDKVEKALQVMFERHKLQLPEIIFCMYKQEQLSVKRRRVVREWTFSGEYGQVCEEE